MFQYLKLAMVGCLTRVISTIRKLLCLTARSASFGMIFLLMRQINLKLKEIIIDYLQT
jgi:hypothetical protein